jgi:very-short-patch-repair endonuclease
VCASRPLRQALGDLRPDAGLTRSELRAAGYTVLRFTWRQVTREPAWVANTVARALAS